MRSRWVGIGIALAMGSVPLAAFGQGSTWSSHADAPSAGDAGDTASPTSLVDAGPAAEAADAAPEAIAPSAPVIVPPAPLMPPAPPSEPPPASTTDARTTDAGVAYEPSDVGFTIGLRAGYSLPVGLGPNGALSHVVTGSVPIGVDVGYTLNQHLYLGAYFVYGFAFNATDENSTCPNDPDYSGCSATQIRFGGVAQWRFRPQEKIDPWVGAGLGYDIINLSADDNDGNEVLSSALHGFDLNFQIGADYKPRQFFGFGPYAEVSLGHYASDGSATTIHGWMTIGFRLRTGL